MMFESTFLSKVSRQRCTSNDGMIVYQLFFSMQHVKTDKKTSGLYSCSSVYPEAKRQCATSENRKLYEYLQKAVRNHCNV